MIGAAVAERHVAPEPDTSTASSSRGLGYHPALDGLRAIAVLAVIAYHDQYDWIPGGFLGVDLFFVLSGFLITTLLVTEFRQRTTVRLRSFWARRARRLLPALLLVLGFVALYTRLVVPWERVGIRNDGLASLFYVANWRFIVNGQSYFLLFAAASPLRHMWSLAIEEQYYLLWPLVVLVCLRAGRGSTRVLGWVTVAGTVVSVAAMWVRFTPGDPTNAYYATDARAHSLLIGALLALLLLRWTPSPRAGARVAWSAVAALLAIVVAFHVVTGTSPSYYEGGSALFAVACAVLIAGAVQKGVLTSALSFAPLVWIGRISYGLYLWHWPIDVWLVPSRVSLDGNALNALRLLITFAAAIVSFFVVEQPIRHRQLRPSVTALAFAPVVAVVAGVVWVSASGATPPPSYLVGTAAPPEAGIAADGSAPPQYLWGYGDPLICGEPRPDETAEAVRAAKDQPALSLSATASPRVLLLGDSTACSLWPGLHAVGDAQGIATDQGSVFGCGIAVDQFTSTRNEAVTPHSERCKPFLDWAIPRALARARPTTVLWMSTWEKSDLVVDGRTLVANTPEWEAEITARMEARVGELTADGAHVVMVTEAAPAPNPAQGTETFDRKADDAGYVRLNDLLRRFASTHSSAVSLVDLASVLCPNGPPCPDNVDGLHARPDGRHFTPTAAVWAARYLLTQIYGTS